MEAPANTCNRCYLNDWSSQEQQREIGDVNQQHPNAATGSRSQFGDCRHRRDEYESGGGVAVGRSQL